MFPPPPFPVNGGKEGPFLYLLPILLKLIHIHNSHFFFFCDVPIVLSEFTVIFWSYKFDLKGKPQQLKGSEARGTIYSVYNDFYYIYSYCKRSSKLGLCYTKSNFQPN